MLRIWRQGEPGADHEGLFLARYERIAAWARQLTGPGIEAAEDLVQDAFIHFTSVKPNLTAIRNLDAFLYTLVRNLHHSQLHGQYRLRQVPLSILDFDSAELGLRVIDGSHLVQVFDELRLICLFACQRKEASLIGSVLILRFFHGYSPSEIAAILRVSRASVDERLRIARKEARCFIENPGKLVAFTRNALPPSGVQQQHERPLMTELRTRVFAARRGECLSRDDLKRLYGPESLASIAPALVAHIVSCQTCLHSVDVFLGLRQMDDRNPDDPEQPDGANAAGESAQLASKRRLAKWRRGRQRVLDHQPGALRITANGLPLASQTVSAERNELSLSIPIQERLQFVEVLSEQEVRLLILQLEDAPPEGAYEQTTEVELSDGRRLSLTVTFDDPYPTLWLAYYVPFIAPERVAAPDSTLDGIITPGEQGPRTRLFDKIASLWQPRLWLSPRSLPPGIAIAIIVVFLFMQTRETALSAAVLVQRAERWQIESVSAGRSVLHRHFDLALQTNPSGHAVRERVEIWNNPKTGAKFSELRDSNGRLLASARTNGALPALTESTVWQFDPSPEAYQALSDAPDHSDVHYFSNRIELRSVRATLTLDRISFRPTGEAIRFGDHEVRFEEISFESIPEHGTPLAISPIANVTHAHVASTQARPTGSRSPTNLVTEQDLEIAETFVRVRLHRAGADLGEQITIARHKDLVQVSGILDTAARRDALTAELADVPHVEVNLSSPENLPDDGIAQALITRPSTISEFATPILAAWLKEHYPEIADRRKYVDHVLALSRECLRRAYALHDLNVRYQAPGNPDIRAIARDHTLVMRRNWQNLIEAIMPALENEPVTPGDSEAWNADRTQVLLSVMRAFDSNLVVLFAGAENAGSESKSKIVENTDAVLAQSQAQAHQIDTVLESIAQTY